MRLPTLLALAHLASSTQTPLPEPVNQIVLLLPAGNSTILHETALSIADPSSPRWRQHLDPTAALALLEPSASTLAAVSAWLSSQSLSPLSRTAGLMTVSAPASHPISALQSIPPSMTSHISGIAQISRSTTSQSTAPLTLNLTLPSPSSIFDNLCTNGSLATPHCLFNLYGLPSDPSYSPSLSTLAVYAGEASSFSATDLRRHLQRFRPAAASTPYRVVGTGDPSNGSPGLGSTFETALDTQTALSIGYPATPILYDLGGVFGPNPGRPYAPFAQFLTDLAANTSVPDVVSFSESQPERLVSAAYARWVCDAAAAAGTRGISLLFSSGDNGPNGDAPTGAHAQVFETEWPASCPFVTAVGGTTALQGEVAATQRTIAAKLGYYYASGGGFSTLYDRPAFQRVAAQYVQEHVPGWYARVAGFRAGGAGVPDVSAFSTDLPTTVGWFTVGVGGTSASTPLWAGVVARLNALQRLRGNRPLGWLNPWLYSLGEGLKDVTQGGDSKGGCFAGCNLSETLGYNVTVGWDPVTGLGSPDWEGLVRALRERQ